MLPSLFLLLVIVVALGLLALVRRAGLSAPKAGAVLAIWLGLVAGLAATGILADFRLPPPVGVVVVLGLVSTTLLARSEWGRTLATNVPLWLLVLSQSFRLPLELVMDRARDQGLMPPQMSFHGHNFDILTGLSALILGLLLQRGMAGKTAVWAWNLAGLGLLINVVTIAVLSLPLPFRVFMNEPANVWITQAPYCWLPTFFVPCALLGHLLVFRALKCR